MGDQTWDLEESSEILVTLSEELNIIVPANDNSPAIYIDVPFHAIREVAFGKLPTESQQPTYGVVMQLEGGATTNCILNAAGYVARHVALAFASEKDANTLKRLLMPTEIRTNGFLPQFISQSGAIDVSAPIPSADEAPALGDSQVIPGTASLSSAIIPYSHAVGTINPSMLERVHTSQHTSAEHQEGSSSSLVEHDEDPQGASHSEDMARDGTDVSQIDSLVEQAIESIDVSQIDGSSREGTQHQYIQARAPDNVSSKAHVRDSQALSNGTQKLMSHFDRTSNTAQSSSLRSHTGLNASQNAQGPRGRPRGRPSLQAVSSVKPVESRIRPEDQDEEHDDLYDASPKVGNGQRRSPRLIARGNIPQNPKQSLNSTARQASIKTGPPTKLSRQLRNADRVVESHTQQTAVDNLAISTSHSAGGVKTNANSKTGKAPAPAKTKIARDYSTKPNKKMAHTKGEAVTTEGPANASLEDFDLPPSPTPMQALGNKKNKKKATTTQPKATKATKAPRNNQKQARPVPKKAAATSSSKGSAPQVKKELKNKAEANGSIQDSLHDTPRGKKVVDDDDAVWDVDQAYSEQKVQAPRQSSQAANAAKRQEILVRAPETEKNKVKFQLPSNKARPNQASKAQFQAPIAHTVKAKPAPAVMSQLRSRRTAAIKANKRIEGLDESDEIVDDEEFVPANIRSKRHAPSDAAKTPKKQEVKERGDGSDDRSTFREKLPIASSLTKDSIPDSISPDSSDEQRPDSVSDPKAGSSPETVNLVGGAALEALEAAPNDTRDNLARGSLTRTALTPIMPLHSGKGDESNQPKSTPADKEIGISEPGANLVPRSAPEPHESITEIKSAYTRPQQDNGVKHRQGVFGATKSAASGHHDQVVQSLPDMDDVSHELSPKPDKVEEEVAPLRAPATAMADETRERRTSPRLAKKAQKNPTESATTRRNPLVAKAPLRAPAATMIDGIREKRASPRLAEKAQKTPIEPAITRRDPFVAKLNALMPKPEEINPNIKSRGILGDATNGVKGPNTHKPAELAILSKEPKARTFEEDEAISFEEVKQVEKRRRHLDSAMHVDGEGKNSPTQLLKPAGEARSGTGVETKRKIEQVGSTSQKRVKLAPQERLEVSARRRPAHDSEKTPPSVVSKKPLLIAFSSTGPKNQGTSSTKKPKPPKNVGRAAPTAEESRKQGIPNPTTNHVEADFASVQKPLELPTELVQHYPKIADLARKEARDSPQRKQAKHLKNVTGVATRQASTPERSSQKRKLAPFLDEPAPWEHEQLKKRQKRDLETPPTAHNHRPKKLPSLSPLVIHDRSQRLSSQNTRVNENGSPMPFLYPHYEHVADEGQYSDEDEGKDALADALLEEQIGVSQEDDPVLPEPSLPHRPLVPAPPKFHSKTTAYQSRSNNSKQVPSSPHAASAFATLPPHHIYRDGGIVNAETKEAIIPSIPQDPFLGATQNRQNPFMDALRKSTKIAAKRPVAGASEKKGSGGANVHASFIRGEDPDKTLVEPKVRRKYKQVRVSDSSSSSPSGSSIQESHPDEPSEEESDTETEAKWRKALEPHQENMLECLLTISHVSKALQHLLADANPRFSVWFNIWSTKKQL